MEKLISYSTLQCNDKIPLQAELTVVEGFLVTPDTAT